MKRARPKWLRVAARALPRRGFWLLAAGLGAAVAYAAYYEANDPRFALTSVTVHGAAHTGAADVAGAAGLQTGQNVWLVNAGDAERRIEALPWVESARVARTWPNRLAIQVVERVPVARVAAAEGGNAEERVPQAALIDATQRVLAIVPIDETAARLPLFRVSPSPDLRAGMELAGSDVEQAYDALVQLRALGLRISEVNIAPTTGIAVTCDGGLHVIFGSSDDIAAKVGLYKAIQPKIAAPENVVYVDLRSVRAPTVLYR